MSNDPVNIADYRRQREVGRMTPLCDVGGTAWDQPHPSALSDADVHLPHPSTLGDPGTGDGNATVGADSRLPRRMSLVDASESVDPAASVDSSTARAWESILGSIPRGERLRYAGLLGEEIHLIDILAFDPDPAVRRCVALHPGLTVRGQWALARDPDSTIRQRLASNECAAPEILSVLGRDLDPVVRASVAAHEATPESVRRRLSRDRQPVVREALRNARTCER